MPEAQRTKALNSLSTEAKAHLAFHWPFWARPSQLPPTDAEWQTWLVLAGRGFGKTELGAQWIRSRALAGSKGIALVAETQKDLEEVMVARILAVHAPHERPEVRYRPVRMTWANGTTALGYNGTEPDQLRGPEFEDAWVDELAKYRYARETWDMLQFTMRVGLKPRVLVTTTPRPIPVIKEIAADKGTRVTKGSTEENRINLAPSFLANILSKYEGTRLGRQELHAEILDDFPGAMWTRAILDGQRVREAPSLQRIVVSVDPSGTSGDTNSRGDDVGIVVTGLGNDGFGYVLEDLTCNMSPDGWARVAVNAFHRWKADRIIAERNFGGAMVEAVIRTADRNVPYREVTASRGKAARAEPVAALYEQKRVFHVGSHPLLEDELCAMTPSGYQGDGSPNRTDAMVWGITDLMLGNHTSVGMFVRQKHR